MHLTKILDNDTQGSLIAISLDITLKLQAMHHHITNYEKLDKYFEEFVLKEFKNNPNVIHNANILLFELEAFLFQFKSSLDMMIKVFGVLFPGRFKTHTFQDKGARLIKNLRKYKTQKGSRKDVADRIINLVETDKNEWISKTVDLRDTVSHYNTFAGYCYKVVENSGELKIEKGTITGGDHIKFMHIIMSNTIDFIQDLLSLAIVLKSPPIFDLAAYNTEQESVSIPAESHIKYSLGLIRKQTIQDAD